MWARPYFSMFGEDVFLLEYFQGKPNGLYVDVGGFHPVQHSNTYAFYRNGWRGIVVEPNPHKAPLFQKHRPCDILVSNAISDVEGSATFAVDEDVSGIVDSTYFHQTRAVKAAQITVRTRPLKAVFDEHIPSFNKSIDILSVDCEGHDEVVLRSNDWNRYRPLLVLCEAFDKAAADRLNSFLDSNHYRHIAACGPTLIFEDLNDRPGRRKPYH